MSRPSKQKRDKAKAKAAQRSNASKDPANHIQSGKVKSVISGYQKFASLSSAPSFSYAPNRYKSGVRVVDQSHKPAQELMLKREYPPSHGRTNLYGKPVARDFYAPDTSHGYTIASSEPENLERKRKVIRMCRKARRRHKRG